MPAIERVIPIVGHLPASIREMLLRQLRSLTGLGLIALSGVTGAAAAGTPAMTISAPSIPRVRGSLLPAAPWSEAGVTQQRPTGADIFPARTARRS